MRYIIVHKHCYQPPREDAHTGLIPRQLNAAPYRNWNFRIDAECYNPNGHARIVDLSTGKLIGLVNNFEFASFNVGPTLLTWLADYSLDTLNAILEGDRLSRERLNGHGNAIAQVFNHAIMPLATLRDKHTQVVWGIEAFRSFFGREPEGMHLAETAVDIETLEVLADHGIKFTVLAPRQAKRFRKLSGGEWQEGGVDPSRAYLVKLPSGRTINVFFYDGPVSQAVAFERLLDSGEKFLNRLMSGFNDSRQHEQLMHISVDGETFGHHHKQGEMCLAWVFDQLRKREDVMPVNYGYFLELNPAAWEVEINAPSSWSCEHGVKRWSGGCPCQDGDGNKQWNVEWRKPLRDSLNHLREKLDAIFEREGAKLFRDPWAARDAYIRLLLDKKQASAWFEENATAGCLDTVRDEVRTAKGEDYTSSRTFRGAVSLMEMERFGMYMFTSCAWFFDDLARLEPVQNLRYALRAIELAAQFTDEDLETGLVNGIADAPGNLPDLKTGRAIWEAKVKPGAVLGQLNMMLLGSLDTVDSVKRLMGLIDEARRIGLPFDLPKAQNMLLDVYANLTETGNMTGELSEALGELADKLMVARTVLGYNHSGCVRSRTRGWQIPQLMSLWGRNRLRSCSTVE